MGVGLLAALCVAAAGPAVPAAVGLATLPLERPHCSLAEHRTTAGWWKL